MKNRVKRMVSAVTAFCIAGGAINTGSIFPAADNVTVFAEPDSSADSSTAVKRIRRQSVFVLGGLTSLTNGMITLYYDSEMVSVKDIKTTSQLSGMTVSINDDVPGRIVVGFASVDPKNVIDDLFYVDYEYSTDLKDIPQFGIRVNELETEDKDGNIIQVDKERVASSDVTSGLELSVDNVYTDTDVNGNISIDLDTYALPLAPVTNGECTVIYDPEVMQFVSSEQIYDKNGVLIDMNETEPGKLKITFVSAENIGDTILSRLYFKPLKNTVSEVVLKTDELTGVVAEDYILSYTASGSYETASSFGIDIPGVSDRLQFNRKGTFRIGTDGNLSVTNGILTVKYDTDKLEFKDIKLSEAIKGAAVNTDVPGKIVIGFASVDPITFDEVIADIDFAFPAGLAFNLNTACWVSVDELETENEDGTVITVDRENIFYYPLAPQYDLEMKKSDQSEEIEAVIKLERNQGRTNGVTNGTLEFYFDPEVLEFSGVSPAAGQNGLLVDANEVEPGKVRCVFVSDSPVTTDGEILYLKFKPLRSCYTEVELSLKELMNTVSEDEIYEYGLSCGAIISCYNVELPEPAVTSEPAVTTPANPVTSAAPVTTAEVKPVTSAASVTTAEVKPVTSAAPVTTAVLNPVTSAAPVTTAEIKPVTSAAPVTTAVVKPVTSAAPVTTAVVKPVTSAAPVTTAVVKPVTSAAPVTTAVVKPVTSAAPVTTAEVKPVTSAAPVTTAEVKPVTSAAPVTTAEVKPVTSAAPVTTAEVKPVTSEAPVSTPASPVITEPPVTEITVPVLKRTGSVRIGADEKISVTDGKIVLTYDPDKMTFESISLDDQISGKISEISTSEPGKIVIGFKSDEPLSIDHIADVKFSFADGITASDSLCTLDVQKLETVDETGASKPVDPLAITAKLTISAVPAAEPDYDINGDGSVNTLDLLKLVKMIIDPHAAKKVTADLNSDGSINAEDALILRKLLKQ